jgi:hypothetical protein
MPSERYGDSSGTIELVFTGTGIKILDGGLAFGTKGAGANTPALGVIYGATFQSATISNPSVQGPTPASITGSSQVLTQVLHANRKIVANRAAGIAFTLPAATGTGDTYEIIVGTTVTSGSLSVAVASATDFMVGHALFETDDASNVPQTFPTANTGTVATESDTITFNRTTSGVATRGDRIVCVDIASAIWSVYVVAVASGTEVTPFSVAV